MKLSITMPSLQQGTFIERAIRSVPEQELTGIELEFFVMDGGSTDETLSIIKKYDSRITAWRSRPDEGQTAAINEGFRQSSGDVLAYINSDDFYLPKAFQEVRRWWQSEQRGASCWLAGGAKCVDLKTNRERVMKVCLPPLDPTLTFGLPWCPPQPSCFWGKELFTKYGWLETELDYVMDVEWNTRLVAMNEMPTISEEVLSVRWLHEQAKSADRGRFFLEMQGVVRNQKNLTDRQQILACKLLKNRERYQSSALRYVFDLFAYPKIIFVWLRRLPHTLKKTGARHPSQ